MFYIKPGTRIIQKSKSVINATFQVYNNQLSEYAEINLLARELLYKAYQSGDYSRLPSPLINQLLDMGILLEGIQNEKYPPVTFCETNSRILPLTSLSIELTNMCNLRCKHCYGAFADTQKPEFIPYDWIKTTCLSELNKLNTRNIALTGGEPTLHPQFLDIALLFLQSGFDLCVLSNGNNPNIISTLLEKSSQYQYTIKISLDGIDKIHNLIRGTEKAFANTIQTLDCISKYDNVTLFISTALQHGNIGVVRELDQFVKEHYPRAIHTKDIVFPMGSGCDCAFSLSEVKMLHTQNPELFSIQNKNRKRSVWGNKQKKHRCSGGISQCTLMSNGNLKICNAACDDRFIFQFNAFSVGLTYAWTNCGNQIKKYRGEKDRATKSCKHCMYRKKCHGNDCRVLAWAYTGDEKKNNPLTCLKAQCGKE